MLDMRRKNVKGSHLDPLEAAIERELVKRDQGLTESFYDFVVAAWPHVESYPFKTGMHVRAICDHLQACAERRIKNLCINIAPRHSKSVLCSQLFPAWILARSPKETLLYASHSAVLANRDSVKTRALVESDWYQARWPHVQIRDDSNLKSAFVTTVGGGRQATSVGGTVTGLGGSFLVLDDPIDAGKSESDKERENANVWFTDAWMNRVQGDPTQAVRIVIMQRLHAHDVAALCKEQGWEMLVLPTEYEGASPVTSIGWSDPRTQFGELLWPDHHTAESLAKYKANTYVWAGQYQQRPTPRSGGIIKHRWVRYWYDPERMSAPEPMYAPNEDGSQAEIVVLPFTPPSGAQVTASWDCSFKGGMKNDFVVGQIWYRRGGEYFLLDQIRDHLDMPATCDAVRLLHERWRSLPTLVEGKANGPAVVQTLRSEVDGLLEIDPQGGKEARVAAVAPLFEAGNVYLPHPKMYDWVGACVTEIVNFPRGVLNDDQVDSMSQALVHMRERKVDMVDMGQGLGGTYAPDSRSGEIDLVSDGSYWVN
jgi:predicted phage terminase large subunit-like protein